MRCDWAACDKTAATREDGWNHCREHLALHREFKPKPVPLIERLTEQAVLDLIARRHAEQYPDTMIALELECDADRIRRLRHSLGLEAVGGARRVAQCGTRSGFGRHKVNHETPCDPCREVERDYQRLRATRRRRPAACGTRSGFGRHKANGETPCTECREVEREYQRDRAARRRRDARCAA